MVYFLFRFYLLGLSPLLLGKVIPVGPAEAVAARHARRRVLVVPVVLVAHPTQAVPIPVVHRLAPRGAVSLASHRPVGKVTLEVLPARVVAAVVGLEVPVRASLPPQSLLTAVLALPRVVAVVGLVRLQHPKVVVQPFPRMVNLENHPARAVLMARIILIPL